MADAQREVHERLGAIIRGELLEGEELLGMLIASNNKGFTQQMYGIGVTPDRLVMVPVTVRWQPKGDPYSIRPQDLSKVSGGSEFMRSPVSLTGYRYFAEKAKLKLHDGRKYNFLMNGLSTFADERMLADHPDPDSLPDGATAMDHWLAEHRPG